VQFPWRATDFQLAVFLHHGDAGGIIAAIFEAFQAVENQGHDGFGADVTDNSAHEILLLEGAARPKLQAAAPAVRLAYRLNETTTAARASAADVTACENRASWELDDESVEEFETEFLNDRVGEHVLGNPFHLGFGFLAAEAIQRENEELALANVANGGIAQRRQRSLNGLTLGIKNRRFQHDPYVSFHR